MRPPPIQLHEQIEYLVSIAKHVAFIQGFEGVERMLQQFHRKLPDHVSFQHSREWRCVSNLLTQEQLLMVAHLVPLLAAQRFDDYFQVMREQVEEEDDKDRGIPLDPLSPGVLSSGMMNAIDWHIDVREAQNVAYPLTKPLMDSISSALHVEGMEIERARKLWKQGLRDSHHFRRYARRLEWHSLCYSIGAPVVCMLC